MKAPAIFGCLFGARHDWRIEQQLDQIPGDTLVRVLNVCRRCGRQGVTQVPRGLR